MDKGNRSPNPFVLCKSINWRAAGQADARARLEERQKERKKPVHLQNTYVTRATGRNIPRIRKELAEMWRGPTPVKPDESIAALYKMTEKKDKNKMRQTARQLIESKRDIFHLEFAIKNKRDVIAKLRFKSLLANEKMNESERRLIHDGQLFDEFLHVNNETASEAMKLADAESRKHQTKVKRIKDLNSQICETRAQLCQLENVKALKDEIKQFVFLVHHNQRTSDEPITQTSSQWAKKWDETRPTSVQIPFANPNNLLESLYELEDRNLSLIGHFQHSEEEFEEVRTIFKRNVKKIETQIEELKSHMELVENTVERCNTRAEELKFYCSMFESSEFSDQDAELQHFENAIEHVYNETTGQKNLEMNIDSLTMLTFIETRLDDLIEMEESLPPMRVKEEQKERDKQRRIEARERKIQDHTDAQKERLVRAQNRNASHRMKRIGRRLVGRSRPFDQPERLVSEELDVHIDHEADFFV